MTTEPSVFERVVAEVIHKDVHHNAGDVCTWGSACTGSDFVSEHRAKTLLHAFATSDEVREAIVERVDWRAHDHSNRPCCLDAILAAIRPETS